MIEQTENLIGKVAELKELIGSLDGKNILVNIGGNANQQLDLIAGKLNGLENKTVFVNVVQKTVGDSGVDVLATATQPVIDKVVGTTGKLPTETVPVNPVISSAETGALKDQIAATVGNAEETSQALKDVESSASAAALATKNLQRALDDDKTTFSQLRTVINGTVDAYRSARTATGELQDTTVLLNATQELASQIGENSTLSLSQQQTAIRVLTNAERELNLQKTGAVAVNNAESNSMQQLADELAKAAQNTDTSSASTLRYEDAMSRARAANDDATASIIRMQAEVNGLDMVLAAAQGDSDTWNSKLADSRALVKTLGDTLPQLKTNMSGFNTAVSDGIPLWTAGTGLFGAWNGHIQLFGGTLTKIGIPALLATAGTIHIVADSILEIGSTLIPAAIALGAFGVASAGVWVDIYNHEKDVFTVTQALQQQMYPFTGQLQQLQAAVKPEVWVLFGEALQVIASPKVTGAFTELATSAGKALDQLGARLTYALTSGNGFQQFLKHAAAEDRKSVV